MRSFDFRRATAIEEAIASVPPPAPAAPVGEGTQFLAGGTTLVDLMRLEVLRPARVIDINALQPELGQISVDGEGLHLGALLRMSEVSEHPYVCEHYPLLAQSLREAASPQLRNMASLAGNVLQRTRCHYFRDPSFDQCNRRTPGSGCAALAGCNRRHAVLGVSPHCIATYPGDFAQALVALQADVHVQGREGPRTLPVEHLHRAPGETPHIETVLAPDELILGFSIPALPWGWRSLYLKIRDRASYDFALASVAIALDLQDGRIREARIALGGLATRPWRAREAEAALRDQPADESHAQAAAQQAFALATTHGDNNFKPELGRRTLVRAVLACAALEAPR